MSDFQGYIAFDLNKKVLKNLTGKLTYPVWDTVLLSGVVSFFSGQRHLVML